MTVSATAIDHGVYGGDLWIFPPASGKAMNYGKSQ